MNMEQQRHNRTGWILFAALGAAHLAMTVIDSGAMWYWVLRNLGMIELIRSAAVDTYIIPGIILAVCPLAAMALASSKWHSASPIPAAINLGLSLVLAAGSGMWLLALASLTYVGASAALLCYTLSRSPSKNRLGLICLALAAASLIFTVVLGFAELRLASGSIRRFDARYYQRLGVWRNLTNWRGYLVQGYGSMALFYPVSRGLLIAALGIGMLKCPVHVAEAPKPRYAHYQGNYDKQAFIRSGFPAREEYKRTYHQ